MYSNNEEKVPLPQQLVAGLPSGGMVVSTGGIAVVATTSALLAKPLADILLKVVKPTIKKVMKKIAKIREVNEDRVCKGAPRSAADSE